MKTQKLLYFAQQRGCFLDCTCVDITARKWDALMANATKANKKLVTKIAFIAGIIDEEQYKNEIKKPHYNPYTCYKTSTHAIYVNSGIEYFIKIN